MILGLIGGTLLLISAFTFYSPPKHENDKNDMDDISFLLYGFLVDILHFESAAGGFCLLMSSLFTLVTLGTHNRKGIQTLATFMIISAILASIFVCNTSLHIKGHNE